jgi:hypothetical protein
MRKIKKYMYINTKRHLGYLHHFEESPKRKTDGLNLASKEIQTTFEPVRLLLYRSGVEKSLGSD